MDTSRSLVTWCHDKEIVSEACCRACGVVRRQERVLTAPNPYDLGELVSYSHCNTCGSLNVTTEHFDEYTDQDELDPYHWRHYLHVGADIDSMVRPIERVRTDGATPSLLDVGCGFGFTLDYWRRMTGATVAGVEPSLYGRLGRDLLAAPIYTASLTEVAELGEKRFDIVLSSEVVEHVSDPAAFIAELRAHLTPGGTLVLTTPRAEFVRPESDPTLLLAVLSPGVHKLIFSAAALDTLLRAAGFTDVSVEAENERLVAFATESVLRVRPAREVPSRRYGDYVLQRAELRDQPIDLALGFRFRAVKELVNAGQTQQALRHAEAFATLVQQAYGYDPLDTAAVAERVLAARNLPEYCDAAPFCLGPFFYYRAMVERASGDGSRDPVELFASAAELLKHAVALAPECSQEAASLVWVAAMEQGCALLAAERREEAIAVFDAISARPREIGGDLGVVPPLIASRVAFERAAALLQLGHYPDAIGAFADFMAKPGATDGARNHAHRLLIEAATVMYAGKRPAAAIPSVAEAAPAAPGLLRWGVEEPVETVCPACDASGPKPFKVKCSWDLDASDGGASVSQAFNFYGCPNCGCVFPHPFIQPRYEEDFGDANYARLHAQFWAGIEFMIRPLVAVHRLRPVQSFVDAGCGFGYTVDFARRIFGARSLGLDPSAYAQDGARALGVEILPAYLSDAPLPENMRADLLYCSEVIEHVEDPARFMRMLRGHLQPGGVLALTTPDAGCVAPGHSAPAIVIMSALCPGFHRQIFSANALRAALHGAGFAHAKIIPFAHRLIAFASDSPIVMEATLEPDHAAYAGYLEALAADCDPARSDIRHGAVYRLLDHYVSRGDWPRAEAVFSTAEELLQQDYRLSFAEPERVPALLAEITDLADWPAKLPYWLPFGLHFAGMLHLNGRDDPVGARRLYRATHTAIVEAMRLGVVAETAIYWQAVLNEAIAALVAGDSAGAEAVFDRILAAANELPPELEFTELDPATVARAFVQRGVARSRQDNAVGAVADFARAFDAKPLLPSAEARMALNLLCEAAESIRAAGNARFLSEREIETIVEERAEFDRRLAEREEEVASLRRAIDELKCSRSWRLTAPIRKVTTELRRLPKFATRRLNQQTESSKHLAK